MPSKGDGTLLIIHRYVRLRKNKSNIIEVLSQKNKACRHTKTEMFPSLFCSLTHHSLSLCPSKLRKLKNTNK